MGKNPNRKGAKDKVNNACPRCKGEAIYTRYSNGGKGVMAYNCNKCGVIDKMGKKLD